MVGEVPAGRMIVNPNLDVPRFSADGQVMPLRIVPRRNKPKQDAAVPEALADEQAQRELVTEEVLSNQQPEQEP
jgi:hypothetical protein